MKVRELRELLARFDSEAEVLIDETEPLDGLILAADGSVFASTATDPMFVHAMLPQVNPTDYRAKVRDELEAIQRLGWSLADHTISSKAGSAIFLLGKVT